MTSAQEQELLELHRQAVGLLQEVVRLLPRAPRDRKLHFKRYVARVLGINRDRLARYIAAGVVRTVTVGKLERISEEELQRHLAAGLPDLAAPQTPVVATRAPARRRVRRLPTLMGNSPSAAPGDAIRALRF